MTVIGNVIWVLLAGLWLALFYLFFGLLMCLTIIGIPLGIQAFKLAGFVLWPFGRVIIEHPGADPAVGCLANVIWIVLGGIELVLFHVVFGLVLCLTIIGIPFGIVSFRMAALALVPFGKTIVHRDAVPPGAVVLVGTPR